MRSGCGQYAHALEPQLRAVLLPHDHLLNLHLRQQQSGTDKFRHGQLARSDEEVSIDDGLVHQSLRLHSLASGRYQFSPCVQHDEGV
jgi:hypothetical protein